MVRRIYNQQKVQSSEANFGATSPDVGSLIYKGFNSRKKQNHFKENDLELIKQDLLNHFHIRKGEKLEQPEFGTVIWSMVFEPMTEENVQIVSEDVTEIINRDPRVNPANISVDATEYGIRVEVDLEYVQLNLTEKLVLDFNKTDV
jgi:phage baseplate assembly protein W